MNRAHLGWIVLWSVAAHGTLGLAQRPVPLLPQTQKIQRVQIVEPTGITLHRSEVTLHLGPERTPLPLDTYRLRATVLPEDTTNKEVVWESSDPTTVRVEADGSLLPLRLGRAVVTAMTKVNGLKARCTVIVERGNHPYGNTLSNLMNGGYLAVQGDWIYYASPSEGMRLHKMRLNGSERQSLGGSACVSINVIGRRVSYLTNDYHVDAVDCDGENRRRLTPNTQSLGLQFVGDRIHDLSLTPSGTYGLYTMKHDGTERTIVDGLGMPSIARFWALSDGRGFVLSDSGKHRIVHCWKANDRGAFSMDVLFEGPFRNYVFETMGMAGVGGQTIEVPTDLYVIDGRDDTIKKIGPIADRSQRRTVTLFGDATTSRDIQTLALAEGWLFYAHGTFLSKMRTDGTQNQIVIANLPHGEHHLFPVRTGSAPSDLWIFVYTKDAQGRFSLLKVRQNGMDRLSLH